MVRVSYLSFVSLVLIPFQLILLVLLAFKIARKQVHFLIEKVINFKIKINDTHIKLFPMFAVISSIMVTLTYKQLMDLNQESQDQNSK